MAFNNPATIDFKNQFVRDFPYGVDPQVSVLDADISSSFQFVNAMINPGLFGDQGTYTLAYLLLAAHYLVLNLRASSQGLNGQYNWLQNSKGVGSVSEAFAIPDRILANAEFSMLAKTNYGAQYLSLILPQMGGQIFTVCGTTQP